MAVATRVRSSVLTDNSRSVKYIYWHVSPMQQHLLISTAQIIYLRTYSAQSCILNDIYRPLVYASWHLDIYR